LRLAELATAVRVPVPDWIRAYRREWLKLDVVAGLTAAAVVIPKAMAYATIAGLPVQVGLYTALLPMLIYAMVGTSRPLSVSTTTTLAMLTAAALGAVAPAGDAASLVAASATLALLVGLILVLAGVLRLGFLANFISEPVLIGFKAGIGLVIVVDQVPKLLGIHFPKSSFSHNLLGIAQGITDASMATMALGALVVGILVALERTAPRAPAPLVAIAIGVAAMSLLGLQAYGVGAVGHVPTGLPSLTLPSLQPIVRLWPAALGIALMSFAETIAAGRAFTQSGEPTPRANRELLATGLANVGGAFLGAMPVGGGTTQTAVNRLAGARSQLAGLVTAGATLATMLLLAPFIGLMPEATLAAIVVVYSVGLIGTLQGILVAIVISLVALAHQVADPPVHVLGRKRGTNVFRPRSQEHLEDETFPGLLLLRPEGRIFFANAERVGEKMRPLIAEAKPTVVALDLAGVFDLEYTALKMLTEAEKRQRAAGVLLWLVGLTPGVLSMVQRSALGKTLGRERMFFNLEQAVVEYQASSARLSSP